MAEEQDTAAPSEFEAALADAIGGGQAGLSALFRAFHPRLLRYLRARDRPVADDVAGETWIAVARGISTFEGDIGAFSAWLFTIARQRLADHHRTIARRATYPVAVVPDDRAHPGSDEVASAVNEAQASVDFVVGNLSTDQADVVLLRTLAGLSAHEIGAMLGRSENWVRVTHHRALRHLRDRLGEL